MTQTQFAPASPAGPSITATALVEKLIADGVLTELSLISLVGRGRHDLNLDRLESALEQQKVLSPTRLAQYKADLSGRPVYLPGQIAIDPALDPTLVKKYGVLLTTNSQPLVLMIEDTVANVQAVREMAGGAHFDIALVTVPGFLEMFAAAYEGTPYDTAPYPETIFDILDAALDEGATDIHLAVGVPPRVRATGSLKMLNFRPLDATWLAGEVDKLLEDRHRADMARKFSTDVAYSYGRARYRVNVATDRMGHTLAFRQLASKIPTADEIDLPQRIRNFADLERGLVLVTGPTGSGKSTTLAALLLEICTASARHVITLEDPIEFSLPRDSLSHVNQRELGSSLGSFEDGIRDGLRQDPDVLLVGEMRDAETIRTALTAAETGHLVLGTLHTYDAPSTISRIVNSFPAGEQDAVRAQLAVLLKGVVSQTLVPRASGRGRLAAYELLLSSPAVSTNLRKVDGQNQLIQAMQTGRAEGMQTMSYALARLVHDGKVSEAEALFRARDRDAFLDDLNHLRSQRH